MYEKTLVQFEEGIKAAFFAENPQGFTKKEWDEIYPRGTRLSEWVEEIRETAWNGTPISPKVLDDLCKRGNELFVLYLRKNTPKAFPEGYLTYQARKQQEALKW